jgi:hypothetical protein
MTSRGFYDFMAPLPVSGWVAAGAFEEEEELIATPAT